MVEAIVIKCHRDSIGPPPDVRMVARWTLESSASTSDPNFSLLSNNLSQPSQPRIHDDDDMIRMVMAAMMKADGSC